MVAAFFITWYSSLRPKAPAFSWLRNVAIAFKIRTVNVVVFIPPAVEPGEPPISINNIITAFEGSLIFEMSMVLNPAVLVVTDWNAAASKRFPVDKFFRSQVKKKTTGNKIKHAVAFKIQFVCINIIPGEKTNSSYDDQKHNYHIYKGICRIPGQGRKGIGSGSQNIKSCIAKSGKKSW